MFLLQIHAFINACIDKGTCICVYVYKYEDHVTLLYSERYCKLLDLLNVWYNQYSWHIKYVTRKFTDYTWRNVLTYNRIITYYSNHDYFLFKILPIAIFTLKVVFQLIFTLNRNAVFLTL